LRVGFRYAQPYAPTISALSLLSTSDIPAVNRAGNTKIDPIGNLSVASAAEIPSKPSPNKSPSGYIFQLR
jgi:hypothetical protein